MPTRPRRSRTRQSSTKIPMPSLCGNSRKSWRCSEVGLVLSWALLCQLHCSIARVSGSSGEDVYDPNVPPEMQKVTYKTKDGRLKTVTKAELQEQMEASEKLMQS